jgi:hypothetical protein
VATAGMGPLQVPGIFKLPKFFIRRVIGAHVVFDRFSGGGGTVIRRDGCFLLAQLGSTKLKKVGVGWLDDRERKGQRRFTED